MPRALIVATITVALTVLGACGDDDDEAAAPDGSTPATAAEGDAFCAAATEYTALLNGPVFNSEGTPDPAAIETAAGELRTALDAMVEVVPDALDDDLDLITDGTDEFLDQLEDAGWDPDAMTADPDFAALEAEFNRQEYRDASASLAGYVQDTCGLDLEATATT